MLENKGSVSARNITIVNLLYDIWVHKVNASKYWKPAMIVAPHAIVGVR